MILCSVTSLTVRLTCMCWMRLASSITTEVDMKIVWKKKRNEGRDNLLVGQISCYTWVCQWVKQSFSKPCITLKGPYRGRTCTTCSLLKLTINPEKIARGHNLHQASWETVRTVGEAWIVGKRLALCSLLQGRINALNTAVALVSHKYSSKRMKLEEPWVGCSLCKNSTEQIETKTRSQKRKMSKDSPNCARSCPSWRWGRPKSKRD